MLLPVLPAHSERLFRPTPTERSIRSVRMLRISVTDRCNLRCAYCMPADGLPWMPQERLLTFEQIADVVRAAASLGISYIKITGGEPTVRRGIVGLVRMLKRIDGIHEVSMTTNGVLLGMLARPLRDAGLDRVTVSLDTLRPERFRQIARRDSFTEVMRGIGLCLELGFSGLKLNCVAMRGFNDDEFADLAALALVHPLTVRFIEYMPLGNTAGRDCFIAEREVRVMIEAKLGALARIDRRTEPGVGPSSVYRFVTRRACGSIGFISAMSAPFCSTCNRMRLTADGRLFACLFDGGEVDLQPVFRGARAAPDRIAQLMRECLSQRPLVHGERGCMQASHVGG